MKHGFIKVATAVPIIRVADPTYNAEQIISCLKEAEEQDIKLMVFPELCITGATCGNLLQQKILLDGAMAALKKIIKASRGIDTLAFIGMPLDIGGRLYSVAAVVKDGTLMAFVPRTNVNGSDFTAPEAEMLEVDVPGLYPVCFNADMLFECENMPGLIVAAQMGEDRKLAVPPAMKHAAAGATLIAELSSFYTSIYSKKQMKNSLSVDSGRLHCSWLVAAPGVGESTTDKVYSGLQIIAENGEIVACTENGSGITTAELDMDYIIHARRRSSTYRNAGEVHAVMKWSVVMSDLELKRVYSKTPFVPSNPRKIPEYCERALDIQAMGLVKRMQHTGLYKPVIGVSGGIDSTIVMLACARAMDMVKMPRENIIAITMPCFGTTDRTKNNAIALSEELGATLRIIPIGEAVLKHFEAIGHDSKDTSVVFENAQARERTMVLMNVANIVGGFNVGTKDLSEQADGWCTFNGDQISNYDINAGMTKSMVRVVVRNYAENCENKALAAALIDICDTPVTPELLPLTDEGELIQKSEDSVGPYDLQDFFLWHMIIRGGTPEKVVRLAKLAYGAEFTDEEYSMWMRSYCDRLFSQQFKRSTTADGPDVMDFTFSPRAGFKMPSDASSALWLDAVDKI